MAHDPLLSYLNDHLAGSRTALQLLDHLIEARDAVESRAFFKAIRDEVARDRDTLEEVIRRAGGRPSVVRDVGGWVAERFSRLKLAVEDSRDAGMHRFEAAELLALGILGKRALWKALDTVASGRPALQDVDFKTLIHRADEQYARMEAYRLDAAAHALAGADRELTSHPA